MLKQSIAGHLFLVLCFSLSLLAPLQAKAGALDINNNSGQSLTVEIRFDNGVLAGPIIVASNTGFKLNYLSGEPALFRLDNGSWNEFLKESADPLTVDDTYSVTFGESRINIDDLQ